MATTSRPPQITPPDTAELVLAALPLGGAALNASILIEKGLYLTALWQSLAAVAVAIILMVGFRLVRWIYSLDRP